MSAAVGEEGGSPGGCADGTEGLSRAKLQPLVVLCQREVPSTGTGFSGGFCTCIRKDAVILFWNRDSQAQRGKADFLE